MARWMNVKSKTAQDGLSGSIDYNDHGSRWEIKQDIGAFLEQAKKDREVNGVKNGHMKKFATIPDVVAIEIKEKYGVDIHADDTMRDADKMKKFKYIVMTEYPYLLSY